MLSPSPYPVIEWPEGRPEAGDELQVVTGGPRLRPWSLLWKVGVVSHVSPKGRVWLSINGAVEGPFVSSEVRRVA